MMEKIKPRHFLELMKKQINLDMVYLLSVAANPDMSVKPLIDGSLRIKNVYMRLLRRELISPETGLVTVKGKEILEYIGSSPGTELDMKKKTSRFDEWWAVYPGTDNFTHKGRSFRGSRTLRANKQKCREKFDAIVNEGDYTAEELIKSLELNVFQKKEMSVKARMNKLTFLQNSLTYLNQRSFEPFVDLLKQGTVIGSSKSTKAKDFDI